MSRELRTHGRYPYSAIVRRTGYAWPGGKRLAVYIGFNVEHFDFGEGLGATLAPCDRPPERLKFGWGEYGNRGGGRRCLELVEFLRVPIAALINTALYDYCPDVIEAFVARGDELV